MLARIAGFLKEIRAVELCGLDAGVGHGYMLKTLVEKEIVGRACGIDLDRERIVHARGLVPDVPLMVSDIYELPFPPSSFDYVIATEILEHLPDPKQALTNMDQLLRPGGYIVASVPLEPYFQLGNILRGKYLKRFGKTPTHLNFWTRKQFTKFLVGSNLNILQHYSYSTFP